MASPLPRPPAPTPSLTPLLPLFPLSLSPSVAPLPVGELICDNDDGHMLFNGAQVLGMQGDPLPLANASFSIGVSLTTHTQAEAEGGDRREDNSRSQAEQRGGRDKKEEERAGSRVS